MLSTEGEKTAEQIARCRIDLDGCVCDPPNIEQSAGGNSGLSKRPADCAGRICSGRTNNWSANWRNCKGSWQNATKGSGRSGKETRRNGKANCRGREEDRGSWLAHRAVSLSLWGLRQLTKPTCLLNAECLSGTAGWVRRTAATHQHSWSGIDSRMALRE